MPILSYISSYSSTKDHLDSIETITDDRGRVVAKYNYDPSADNT